MIAENLRLTDAERDEKARLIAEIRRMRVELVELRKRRMN